MHTDGAMSQAAINPDPTKNAPARVGVILADLGKLNVTSLKYLIVHLNTLQHSIEFELLAFSR